ncbi:unnamed protein product [Ectocarpus fasciculatus]
MSQAEAKPSTKQRLAAIVQGFDDFDTEMKTGTRQRREKDEFKIAELKMEIKRLDQELTVEIKRRTEMNKSTQAWFEDHLDTMNRNFHDALEERDEKAHKKLEVLEDKITALGEHFEEEKVTILKQIEERGQELARMLNEFKEEFDRDRELRLMREAELMKQLTDHEYVVSDHFEKQIQSREHKYAAVRAILEENIRIRNQAEERFQTFYEREVHQLHNSVRTESEVREREDDEIVEALNKYTVKLQTSLKLINSTDM